MRELILFKLFLDLFLKVLVWSRNCVKNTRIIWRNKSAQPVKTARVEIGFASDGYSARCCAVAVLARKPSLMTFSVPSDGMFERSYHAVNKVLDTAEQ